MHNMIFIDSYKAFSTGELDNLKISTTDSNEEVTLLKNGCNYVEKGTFTSEEYEVKELKNLIISWNCETPKDTYIEVEARVFIDNAATQWSAWLSWGKWGSDIKRASANTKDKFAYIDTDVLVVGGNVDITASKIQIRATLVSNTSGETPKLNSLIASYKNTEAETDTNIAITENIIGKNVIETPQISQYLREPSIANSICSPTSITMLLNRLGENLIVEDVAWTTYDYRYEGFGNWTFNTAFAGSLGYFAYVEYGDLSSIMRELEKGYPVAASVKYTNDLNVNSLPYIENAPTTTSGHLIVVCGLEKDSDGNKYVVVNDPAAKSNEGVTIRYKLNEFQNAWAASNSVMYVINRE